MEIQHSTTDGCLVAALAGSIDWPATSFALCAAQAPVAEILHRLHVPHFLQLYPGSKKPSMPCSPGHPTCGTSCCWPPP